MSDEMASDQTMRSEGPIWGTLGTQGYDERPLCLHCLAPLRPDAHFCKRCMAPVSSYAGFGYFGQGNYEAIWSTAWILHQAIVTREPTKMHVWGVALVFGPGLLVMAFLLVQIPLQSVGRGPVLLQLVVTYATTLISAFIAVMFIWRAWSNYVRGTQLFPDEVFD